MRAYLPAYDMRRASTLDDALRLLADTSAGWWPFAGGTDLMVLLAAGSLRHQRYVSLWDIDELRGIQSTPEFVSIGALTTFSDVRRNQALQSEFPLLCEAAAEIGAIANQNRATVGGNIANASPAADFPPALLAYEAELELISMRGSRRLPYRLFHTGYKQMDLAPDELIRRVWLPRPTAGASALYRKVGTRRAQAISKICFAATARMDGNRCTSVRLAFGSVAPTPMRASHAERALEGVEATPSAVDLALEALESDLSPIDDLRSTASYRLHVGRNLVREFMRLCRG